jgi:hypothetical protein
MYLIHEPDPETPLEETVRVVDDLVRTGKELYVGTSNIEAWRLARALWISDKEGAGRASTGSRTPTAFSTARRSAMSSRSAPTGTRVHGLQSAGGRVAHRKAPGRPALPLALSPADATRLARLFAP